MNWLLGYLLIAILAGSGAFAWGGWVRPRDEPAPLRSGWTALLAGVMWPILLVAFAQLGVIMAIAKRVTATRRQVARPAASAHHSPTPTR